MSVRRLLAILAMLSPLAAAPLLARPLEVTISPVPAVWTERVQVTVAGLSATACGPGAVSIDDPVVNVYTGNIEVDLREPCNSAGPPVAAPFALTTSVYLEPGSYSLRVVDWALGGSSEPSSFTVYEPPIGMAVELPARSTTTAPGALTLHLMAAYTPPQPQAQVDGNVVSVTVAAVDPPSYPQRPFRHVVLSVPLPELAAGTYDVRVFFGGAAARAVLSVWNAAGCVPDAATLCLAAGRFRVTGTWRTHDGTSGVIRARVPPEAGDRSALLWFFAAGNPELTLKLIDACSLNGRWWLFLASGSNVEYQVRVEDTRTGETRLYMHPEGSLPPLVSDVDAFGGCEP